MNVLLRSCVLLAAAGVVLAQGATPGDEVVVIYNTRVPESKALAEYYAQKRQVPASQVFGFGLSSGEEMSRAEFRDALQTPLAKALETNKLWRIASRIVPATANQAKHIEWRPAESKIRYAVLCYGVPVRIAADSNVKEPAAENLRAELKRNEAAVDSELALLPLLEQRLPLTGPLNSPVYSVTNAALLHPTNGVLMVARLDGPTAAIARGLVDKALEAEADGLWGRAYIDLRNTTEQGYKMGDDWIRNAGEVCRHLGFETVVDNTPGTFPAGFPMSQIAIYVGWYDNDASGPFAQPTVEFMPGAFAYHLHSYSAHNIHTNGQYWVGPLLAKGATITMGCVTEPYLGGTPDVGVFTSRLLFSAFSFGEAAYASQPVLSWQITVIGDPLYRPAGRNPDQIHDTLLQKHSPLVGWYYLRLLNINLVVGKSVADCVDFLEKAPATKESAVMSEKLGDFYSTQGKPSSAVLAYTQALERRPSPQQRLRLRLTLGEKLAALDRSEEAFEMYQKVLAENADYPDKLAVYHKLLPLAQKLNKPDEARKVEEEIQKLSPSKS